MQIRIDIDTAPVAEAITRLRQRASDLSPFMADAAETLYTITDESFDAQASPAGAPWTPLASATLRAKRTDKILYESGNLRGSLYADSSATEAHIGIGATAHGYPYGIVHQFGSRRIPARPFLPLSPDGDLIGDVVEDILSLLETHLQA